MSTNHTLKGTAREHILKVAGELFYREGIRAVGVDAIIAQAGVARMSFYRHFKSKEALVVEFLQHRDERWRQWLAGAVERLAPNPQGRPLAVFDALEERFSNPEFRGCAFINSMAEMGETAGPIYQVGIEHKKKVEHYIRGLLEEAGASDLVNLSQQFMLLIDGAMVVAAREGMPQAARTARQIAALLLAQTEIPLKS